MGEGHKKNHFPTFMVLIANSIKNYLPVYAIVGKGHMKNDLKV